jgi:transketolase
MVAKLTKIKDLRFMANIVREDIITALAKAKSGHSAGSLGMVDIFTALYFNILTHKPNKPKWEKRDYLVLSNGHICPVLYATMANRGYFPKKELLTLRQLGSRLQGHPHREILPGLETTSGPLGSGLSQAAGMALGLKMDKKKNLVYCICSDGEQNEGNHWEAVMFAAKNKLNNLIAITDRNHIQISGNTEKIMPLNPLDKKYKAFGWDVITINGNNMAQILKVLNRTKKRAKGRNKNDKNKKPLMIIANVIPGKGVKYMENDSHWHGATPGSGPDNLVSKENQEEVALAQIHKQEMKLTKFWERKHKSFGPVHLIKRGKKK